MDTKKALIEFFEYGAKEEKRLGLELEHFVLNADNTVCSFSGGVENLMKELSKKFPNVKKEDERVFILSDEVCAISLEPGAQIEVSIKPFQNAEKIGEILDDFYEKITPILDKHSLKLITLGTLDSVCAEDIELIPKKRYEYMDRYFGKIGDFGRQMMRTTASAQVSIDYSDEEDFIKKYRCAYLISPFLAMYTANTKSYLRRLEIWSRVDNKRTMPPKDLFSGSFGFASYANYIMKTPLIYMPQGDGYIYTGEKSVETVSKGIPADKKMLEHYLSMVFPDVRLKNYIEIRIGDSMDKRLAVEYVKLIGNILYDKDKVRFLLKRYKDIGITDIENAKKQLVTLHQKAEIYSKKATDEFNMIMKLGGI